MNQPNSTKGTTTMNTTDDTTNTADALGEGIKAKLSLIQDDATCQFCNQASVVLMKMEVRLPQDIEDEDNHYFYEFTETYRRFLINDRRAPFILWMRDKSLGQQRYLCGLFLNGFCMPSLDGYFQTAETLWCKTLGRSNAQNLIGRCMENDLGQPMENGIRLKRRWGDNVLVLDTIQLWILDMYHRSCRVRNLEKSHLVFGASYRRWW
jgi:hypothetical protein